MVANKKQESGKVDHLVIKRKKAAPSYRKNNKQKVSNKRRKNDRHRKKAREDSKSKSKSKSKEDVSESMSMGNIHIGGLVSHLLDVPDLELARSFYLFNGSYHESCNVESKGGKTTTMKQLIQDDTNLDVEYKQESSKVGHLVIKRNKAAPSYRKNNKQESSSKRRKNDCDRKESNKKGVTSCKSKRTQQKAREDSKSKEDVSESMSMGNIHIGGLVSHLLDVPDHIIGKFNVSEADVEKLLVSLILDNQVQGYIDQVNMLLECRDRSKGISKHTITVQSRMSVM
ncbi:COP9 signalosome complex subunit 2 [Tanacetum coccineum]